MSAGNVDPTKSKVQLEKQRERIKSLESQNKQQEQSLLEALNKLHQKDIALDIMRNERDDLRIKWAVMEAEMKHIQKALTLSKKDSSHKRSKIKRQGFIASLIFLLSSVLVNIGTSLLTSNPPNGLGWIMMVLATVSYVIAALMTTLFAEGENS